MPAKVVDASALAAVLFGEPEAPSIAERLGDSPLTAPTLFSYEIANICWKKLRRHPQQRPEILEAYSLLRRMKVEEVEVPMAEVLLLADQLNLTAYDASYLWLSRKLGLELVTVDGALKRAAEAPSE